MRGPIFLFCLGVLMGGFPAWAAHLSAGPMLGHATPYTASVWLQADGPAEAQIAYWREDVPGTRQLTPALGLGRETDFSARIELTDLRPGGRYRYTVLLDGKPATGELAGLRTPPLWKGRGEAPAFTVYLGSCADRDDPDEAGPGKPGGDQGIFASIAAAARGNEGPHAMLWLGDNVYFRGGEPASPWAMNARYRARRADPALGGLLAATRHYAIWDDHDYGPERANRSFEFKADSLALFQRYWANPSYGLPGLPGVFTRFTLGDADFFLLDDRGYRASDTTAVPKNQINLLKEARDMAIGTNTLTRILGRRYLDNGPGWLGEEKGMFGAAQMDWLKQALINSTASFKVVVSGSQLFNDAGGGEGWHNFPGERAPFLEWLAQQRIDGLLFLSGDRHHSELIRVGRKDDYPLYELTCSPLVGTAEIAEAERKNPQRVDDTLVTQRNYCRLEFTGSGKERGVTLGVFDGAGRPLWSKHLALGDLALPPAPEPGTP